MMNYGTPEERETMKRNSVQKEKNVSLQIILFVHVCLIKL
jgi:hypothetical protein